MGANYSHNNTPLAHPLGANFREYIFIANYQFNPKISLELKFIRAEQGEDNLEENWGSNILLPYGTRERDFENVIGQGVKSQTSFFSAEITYQPRHNVFLDLHYFIRKKESIENFSEAYLGISTRMNIGKSKMEF